MRKKLVKLDASNGWNFCEVDPVKVKRTASALQSYIEKEFSNNNDQYGVRKLILPICEKALNEISGFPVKLDDIPLGRPCLEGLLPKEFCSLFASFTFAVIGGRSGASENIIIDGERFEWMEFEEEGDWPEVVQRSQEERRAARMAEFKE
jgi:hypothetical protein